MSKTPIKYQNVDSRFEPSHIPIQTPWREYAKFNKYDENYPIILYQMGLQGKTKAQIAATMKCSIPTMMRWIEEIPDMKEAWELAMTQAEAYWDDKIESVVIAEDTETALPSTNTRLLERMLSSRFRKFNDSAGPETQSVGSGELSATLNKLMESYDKLTISGEAGNKTMNFYMEPTKESQPEMIDVTPKSDGDE